MPPAGIEKGRQASIQGDDAGDPGRRRYRLRGPGQGAGGSGATVNYLSQIEQARKSDPLGAQPRLSCISSIKILHFFENIHGVDTAPILRRLGRDRDFCTNPANWLTHYETFWLYYGCHQAVSGFTHRDWVEVGSHSDPAAAPAFVSAILQLLPVGRIYQRVPWYTQRLSRFARYSILASTPHSVRYRLEVSQPKPRIRDLFSLGAECRWHQGILRSVPQMHCASLPPATVHHEVCAAPLGHLLTMAYRVAPERFAYTADGFRFDGRRVARWVTLNDAPNAARRFRDTCTAAEADALMLTVDLVSDGRTLFTEGEIYDAPHCELDVAYQDHTRFFSKLLVRSLNLTEPFEEQVRLTQEKYFEADRARRALAAANETIDRYSRDLEALVGRRTADLESTNRRLQQEIDTRTEAQRQLTESLEHKEAMLKEIHHRVKNNLQIVVSLLDMTIRRTADPTSLAVLDGAKNKIQSMALIHSHLYMSPDLNHVDIRQHVIELAGNLRLIYDPAMRIDIRLNITEVWLPLCYAMPCSLILNELITNGFKHAFGCPGNTDGRSGWLQVFIRTPSQRALSITVSDNGRGLDGSSLPQASGTLGLTLVQALVRNQLKSELAYRFDNGAVFEFSFQMTEEEPWRIGL